jgi:uncharacterized phage protein gp47/JayE
MATNFTRPTLAEIIDRVSTDIESNVTGVTARLRRRVEYALARAVAGVSHSLHGHLAWVAEQILPDTAAERFVLRWGDLLGLTRTAAVQATGTVTATGSGGDLVAGTHQFVRLADGALFGITVGAVNITVGSTITVEAVVAGDDGNVTAGQELVLASPVASVDSAAVVVSITGGADQETLAHYLDRILDRMQNPPMGGAPGDHVTWALEVAGVTRAWEYKGKDGLGNPALGKIAVAFVYDQDDGSVDLPTVGEVTAMQAYLDARSAAEVIAFAPTAIDFDYDVTLTPNGDATVEAAVAAEVLDMLQRDAEPGSPILLSRLVEAISSATGETSHGINSSSAGVTPAFGEIYTYGTATFS